ncbi:MAG: CO dehydrogenase/CO-methylating acetyl-CoA synthase complex subunit beta [Candidatus Nezhaarchaeota archaeon]|nr:CO dehydrogenase/CO-methylating acetyl-CoA synthase complex subunit beta [Candidatus Nezhaarchaeota archaeon]
MEGFPVDVGPVYEGERIRKEDMYVEFGGPKVEYKCELVLAKRMDEVEDGKVEVVGPDLKDMKEEGSYPLANVIYVAGAKIEKDLEPVIERRIHDFTNYIEGMMHLNQRYDIWIRISKKSFKKGLNTLKWWGIALIKLFKSAIPLIEKIQVTFYTDPAKVKEVCEMAMEIYKARDARVRGMRDDDVDSFYGCVLCQSFAPQHVCVIPPNRVSLCGAMNWFDARAAASVDPKGPNFPIPKGRCLDPIKGEYEGVNKVVEERTLGANKRFFLHSAFGHPHTSCGCFETIAFYIPEVDGFGVVDRGFKGATVNGLPFSSMAAQAGGGIQTEGFVGMGLEYYRSPKFLQADGGWSRIVWISSTLRKRIEDAIPEELRDKIATEADVANVEELKKFLVERGHPLAVWIKQKEAEAVPKVEAVAAPAPAVAPTPGPVAPVAPVAPAITPAAPGAITIPVTGGLRIELRGARIKIDKIVIKRR